MKMNVINHFTKGNFNYTNDEERCGFTAVLYKYES